jgi:hypothetical protein
VIEPLRGLGFVEAGGFAVDRMPGVHVQLLVHVVDRIQTHVYEHPQAGNWLELVSRYQDNSVFVVTNLPSQGVVRPPWNTTVNVEPDAGTGSMVQRLLKDRKREPLEPVSQNHAKIAFEIAYAQFMAWKKKTGITPEEVAHQIRRRLETPVA